MTIHIETLTHVLGKMFNQTVTHADYQTQQLHGGTLGDVQLVTGTAETASGAKLPYRVVYKVQKKWARHGDPNSWRREYDLYCTDLNTIFTQALRWPTCYHAQMGNDEIHLWMEHIEGVSGSSLTLENLEHAAMEIGRFQGRLFSQRDALAHITCLGDTDYVKREYDQWLHQAYSYEFLCSDRCRIPEHAKQMLRNNPWNNDKTIVYNYLRSHECSLPHHLKQMLIDFDLQMDTLWAHIQRLPVVLCHRDFWIENIFVTQGNIVLIDWDCAAWGYMGEDIASLIVDDTPPSQIDTYYHRLVPAYCKGLSEYIDIPQIDNLYIPELMLMKFGYRMVQEHMFTQSTQVKQQQELALQKVYGLIGG